MKQFELNQTYCKVLLTISELNKQSYYPLNEGIYKFLDKDFKTMFIFLTSLVLAH